MGDAVMRHHSMSDRRLRITLSDPLSTGGKRADRVFKRHAGIERVQLVEIDVLELQAHLDYLASGAKMLGPAANR